MHGKLKNTSANQSVRQDAGKILYNRCPRPMKLDSRSEPVWKFSTYATERLDPRQEASQSVWGRAPENFTEPQNAASAA